MDVREAVLIAKKWVEDVLGEEGVHNIGLEEVNYDEMSGTWAITIGFSRPWNSTRTAFTSISGEPAAKRTYRIITIKEPNGIVTSMRRPGALDKIADD
jgi:hypothetical protein